MGAVKQSLDYDPCDECGRMNFECSCGPDCNTCGGECYECTCGDIPREAKAEVINAVLTGEIHYSPTDPGDIAEWWHYDLNAKAERDARDFDFESMERR